MKTILLLEDDHSLGYILKEYLLLHDFYIDWAKSGEEALEMLHKKAYHLALLDVMLPGIDGFELAKEITKDFPKLPFIFISAKSLKIDLLKGLKLGACDYLTKPVDEELLVAKINSLLNHTSNETKESSIIQIGKLKFSPQLSQLHSPNNDIQLTARESEVLELLYKHKNQLLPRKQALQEIWGNSDEFTRKSMDVFISQLRKHLSSDPDIKIENIHGKGFVLVCS